MTPQAGSGENRIVVDWDGTCVENKWPDMGDWLPGAKEELRRFLDAGFEVMIFSTRLAPCEVDEVTPRYLTRQREIARVREVLDRAELEEVRIWTRSWKPGARYYIDDKAIEFDGNWLHVRERIANDLAHDAQNTTERVTIYPRTFSRNPDGSRDDVTHLTTIGAPDGQIRQFGTGATRNIDTNKPDFEGFLSPLVLREFGRYMHEHRLQADGSVRASDNWQKGMPLDSYTKSLLRHVMDVWSLHRDQPAADFDTGEVVGMKDALCGVLFNAMGHLYEILKAELEEAA